MSQYILPTAMSSIGKLPEILATESLTGQCCCVAGKKQVQTIFAAKCSSVHNLIEPSLNQGPSKRSANDLLQSLRDIL